MTRAKSKPKQPSQDAFKKIDELEESLGIEELRAALAVHPKLKRSRGRPKGTGIDWSPMLARMADALCERKVKTPGEAAKLVAGESPGHSYASTRKQLMTHFRKDSAVLLKAAEARRRKRVKRLFPKRPKGIRLPIPTRFQEIVNASGLEKSSAAFRDRLYEAVKDKDGEEFNTSLIDFLISVVGDYWEDYNEVLEQVIERYGDSLWHQYMYGKIEVVAILAEAYEKLIPLEDGSAV